jgi:hypothetical protein
VNRARTAIIIGGGIAGPATAMALAKAGLEATVYEARPHGADGGGVMLTLAVNGIDALRTLGADAAAVAAGFPTPQITLRTHTGKRLGVTSTGGALADDTVAHTIQRANLYQALHSQAVARGITVLHGKRLVGAQKYPGVHALRNGAPPPRGEDHQGRRPDQQQQGTEPGRTPAARPDAAGDPARATANAKSVREVYEYHADWDSQLATPRR